jgi:hypothetical protein
MSGSTFCDGSEPIQINIAETLGVVPVPSIGLDGKTRESIGHRAMMGLPLVPVGGSRPRQRKTAHRCHHYSPRPSLGDTEVDAIQNATSGGVAEFTEPLPDVVTLARLKEAGHVLDYKCHGTDNLHTSKHLQREAIPGIVVAATSQ